MRIRPCEPADLPSVQEIYAHHVTTGVGTFEEEPPPLAEIEGRFRSTTEAGFPFVVAEIEGRVAGYGYAGPFRTRAAYRFTCENSVYVAAQRRGQGVGLTIMRQVIDACRRRQMKQMLALIGDSENVASVALHSRLGFEHVGVFRNVGFKFERWLDVVLMQLDLTAGTPDK